MFCFFFWIGLAENIELLSPLLIALVLSKMPNDLIQKYSGAILSNIALSSTRCYIVMSGLCRPQSDDCMRIWGQANNDSCPINFTAPAWTGPLKDGMFLINHLVLMSEQWSPHLSLFHSG